MKIIKVINNNVVSSLDEKQKEVVVMGSGIGFRKRAGDPVDPRKIEKIFSLPNENMSQFERLIADIPYEYIKLAEEIISCAEGTLGRKLNKNIYITLTDHLNFALERQKEGVAFRNALLWEIKKFYHREFEMGKTAARIVRDRLGVELSEDEAGFIALHFVNAEMGGDIGQAVSMPEVIMDVMNIFRYTFGVELDETTLSYERFLTHLKFFLQRAVMGQYYEGEDEELNRSIWKRYPDAYACALKIKEYMDKKLGFRVTDEEITYLTVHIARVLRRDQDSKPDR